MKKSLRLLAVLLMLLLVLTGCGSGSSGGDSDEKDTPKDTQTEEVVFEPMTVVDNDYCKIIINELDEDNFWGYSLKVQLENKSSDVTYMYTVDRASVNGIMSDPFWATEVTPGNKANDTISFTDADLDTDEIGKETDIELTFRVYNTDDWTEDDVAYTTVHVYPYGEDKATKYTRADQDADKVVLDTDDYKMRVIGVEEDGIWGYTLKLYLENNTEHNVMFSVDNVSVNGYMIDPLWATSISGNRVSFSDMSFSDTAFQDNDITEVKQIQFDLTIYDDDSYDNYVTQKITLDFTE